MPHWLENFTSITHVLEPHMSQTHNRVHMSAEPKCAAVVQFGAMLLLWLVWCI